MKLRLAVLLATLALASGCATAPRAWERGALAAPEMAFDPDPLAAAYRDHAFMSKEQASGSGGAAAGGCGCSN